MVVKRLYPRGWFLLSCAMFVAQVWECRAATFTVTNADDDVPAPAGSIRQAILDANANPGSDNIAFALSGSGPFTIDLVSGLPSITEPVTIDGTTQTGYSGKPLHGGSAGSHLVPSDGAVAARSL